MKKIIIMVCLISVISLLSGCIDETYEGKCTKEDEITYTYKEALIVRELKPDESTTWSRSYPDNYVILYPKKNFFDYLSVEELDTNEKYIGAYVNLTYKIVEEYYQSVSYDYKTDKVVDDGCAHNTNKHLHNITIISYNETIRNRYNNEIESFEAFKDKVDLPDEIAIDVSVNNLGGADAYNYTIFITNEFWEKEFHENIDFKYAKPQKINQFNIHFEIEEGAIYLHVDIDNLPPCTYLESDFGEYRMNIEVNYKNPSREFLWKSRLLGELELVFNLEG